MKTIRILALALLVLCLALVFVSCGGGSGVGADGTYYRYENGETLSGDWIKLDGKNWEADDDTAGRYEQKGSNLIFYADVFGEEEEVWTATLKDGKLTVEFLGETLVYYKKGMEPTSGGSSSTDKGNTPAPTSSVTYQITYDANGGAFADGKTALTVTERENAALTAPDSPARNNYTFAGWARQKKGSDLWDFASDKANGNLTLYATWKEKSAIVLSVDGATIDGNSIFLYVDHNTESVSLSGKVVCSSDSVWKLYYDKLGQVEIPTKIAAGMLGELDDGDNVFYAVVTSNDGTQVNVYDLTVHRSYQTSVRYYDGSNLLKTESVYTGTTYSTSYRPEITGYTFNRWKTKTGAAAESAFTIWDEQSFYADKTAKTYTVTLDVNGGDPLSQTTKTVTYDAAYSLGTPKRTGYSFTGWTIGGTSLTNASGGSLANWNYDGDRTLRASWSANTYQVTLYRSISEAGSVSGAGSYTYGRSVTVSASTNNGYTWLGWYDQNGNRLTDRTDYTFTMGLDTNIWAKWIVCPVTLTRDLAAGGSVSGVSGATYAGKETTITASTNSGYTWLGWYNGETKLTDNLSYTFTMPTENVSYEARWIKVSVIKSDTAAGSVSSLSGRYKVGDEVSVTATTNNGYTWLGWYNGDTRLTDELSYTFVMPTENVTYTAKWTYYTLTTGTNDANAGTYTSKNAQKTTAGTSVTLSASTNNGYTWLGWYNGETKLTENTSYTFTMPTENVTYTAKWTYYTLTTGTNDANAGTYTSKNAQKTTAGTSVTLSASTNSGYTWLGWYNGETKLTDNLSYTFTMPTENVTYTAKWEISTYSITYHLDGGTLENNPNPTEYTMQSNAITVTGTPTRTGYTFAGWSPTSIPKGSTGNKAVTANWTVNTYSITYNLNGGTNAATNPASYTILTAQGGIALADPTRVTSVTVTNTERLDNGNFSVTRDITVYTFLGWYTESAFENKVTTITYTGAAVELYAKWSETTTTTTTSTESTYLRDGNYIWFGEYPQTIKADEVTVTDTQDARGYYLGSDGAYYAKVTASPNGSGYTFSTGASVTSGTVYYFKVEPIKWRILSESDGVALILCESIIDNHNYYHTKSNRTIDGQTVYPNNYKESDIRAWLNGQFYETAFNELQRELILTTTVDNSARSTNPNNNATQWNGGSNSYACEDTQDKVFLLSEQEVTNAAYGFNASVSYGINDTARRKQTSDFSRATGASTNTSDDYFGNGNWLLRSPYYSGKYSIYVRFVYYAGQADEYNLVDYTWGGVVPALRIQLN